MCKCLISSSKGQRFVFNFFVCFVFFVFNFSGLRLRSAVNEYTYMPQPQTVCTKPRKKLFSKFIFTQLGDHFVYVP